MNQCKPYPEMHQYGTLSVEKFLSPGFRHCDLGIQIAHDGRIWLCVDGEAYIRFKPMSKEDYEKMMFPAKETPS
jgi:hypothetical protein